MNRGDISYEEDRRNPAVSRPSRVAGRVQQRNPERQFKRYLQPEQRFFDIFKSAIGLVSNR